MSLSSLRKFFRCHTGKSQAIGVRPSRPSFKSALETETEKVELPSQKSLRQVPNGTTTAIQHPPKAHLGLPTTSWLGPSRFDESNCPYVGKYSCPTNHVQSHHDLIHVTAADCAICFTAAAPTPIQLQAKHTPRVTPLIAHATCEKQTTHGKCVPVQWPLVKQQHQPPTNSVYTQPRR